MQHQDLFDSLVCNLNFHAKNFKGVYPDDKNGSRASADNRRPADGFESIIDPLPLIDIDKLRCVWSPQCP